MAESKVCRTCGEEKLLDEFHRNMYKPDGRLIHCKKCVKIKVTKARRWDTSKAKARRKKYLRRPEVIVMTTGYTQKYRAKYPDKAYARSVVSRMLRLGYLTPQPCAKCQSTNKIQAHHPDYSKPLKIEWLCHRCHYLVHKKKREGNELRQTSNNLLQV